MFDGEDIEQKKSKSNNQSNLKTYYKNPPIEPDLEQKIANSSNDKMPLGVKENLLIDYFETGHKCENMPEYVPNDPMPFGFFKTGVGSGKRFVRFDYENRLVSEVDFEEIVDELTKRISLYFSNPMQDNTFALSGNQIEKLGRRYVRQAELLQEWPKPLGFAKDTDEFYFERHNFDPVRKPRARDYPHINNFLSRVENKEALLQIIGSILAGEPIRKLSPILWGPGGTGKSTFYRVLQSLFGEKCWALVPKEMTTDKFALTFVKDTVAWFSDETTSRMLNSPIFKELTGSAFMSIREMRQNYVRVPLKGVFFGNANKADLIGLSSDSAIINERLLSCKLSGVIKLEQRKPDIWQKLLAERPYLAGLALDTYEKYGTDVQVKGSKLYEEIVQSGEQDFEDMFDRYFKITFNREDPPQHEDLETKVTSTQFKAVYELMCKDSPVFGRKANISKWKEFCSAYLGFENLYKRARLGGTRTYYVPGIEMHPNVEKIISASLLKGISN